MSQAKLTHKVRNPKAGQEDSWMDIWTATVDNNDDYIITPSDNWQFSVERLTDLVIPFYNLNSESETISSNTGINNLKSINIKLQKDNDEERSAGEIKISAGSNITLIGNANEYSINSIWQPNTATQQGYVSEINDDNGLNLVWGWKPDTDAPNWWPIEELDNTIVEQWKATTRSMVVGKEDPQTPVPGTKDKYLDPNVLWVPNQVVISVDVSQNTAGDYIVNANSVPITNTDQTLTLPNLVVESVYLNGLNNGI